MLLTHTHKKKPINPTTTTIEPHMRNHLSDGSNRKLLDCFFAFWVLVSSLEVLGRAFIAAAVTCLFERSTFVFRRSKS